MNDVSRAAIRGRLLFSTLACAGLCACLEPGAPELAPVVEGKLDTELPDVCGDGLDEDEACTEAARAQPIDEPRTVSLEIQVPGAEPELTTVCLDANENLRCDSSEPRAMPDARGSYRLLRFEDDARAGGHLVAQIEAASRHGLVEPSAAAAAVSFALSAPAASRVSIGALSTLLSVRMMDDPSASGADVERALSAQLGLPSDANLAMAADDEALQHLERAALQALRGAAAAQARAGGMQASEGHATRAAATALPSVLARYVAPGTTRLYPSVSVRTLVGEALGTLSPRTCAVAAPAALHVRTVDEQPILNREDYVAAELVLDEGSGAPPLTLEAEIRGRGNSTWEAPKKPYRIKLGKAASLLGMAAEKDWVLLANYYDKSLTRNGVALCLGQLLEMPHTPAARHVELHLNGEYRGLYQLVEQIETGKNRIDIDTAAPAGGDAAAGFLLEIDERLDDELWFRSAMNVPYTVKSDATPAQVTQIQSVVNAMEEALRSDSFADPELGYAAHLDVEALVDFYLVNELLRNNDAFYASTFITRQRGEKLRFGPIWDFDLTAGNVGVNGNGASEGWWVRSASAYIARLMQDRAFEGHVAGRWMYLRDRLPTIWQFIDETAAALETAQARDVEVWPTLHPYGDEIAFLQSWLEARASWIDAQLPHGWPR